MLIVKKFGGSSVADKERILNVAERCVEEYKKGNDVVVVLSAMGKTTDHLIDMAHDINPNPSKKRDGYAFSNRRTDIRSTDVYGDGNPWSSICFSECISGSNAYLIQLWKCKI